MTEKRREGEAQRRESSRERNGEREKRRDRESQDETETQTGRNRERERANGAEENETCARRERERREERERQTESEHERERDVELAIGEDGVIISAGRGRRLWSSWQSWGPRARAFGVSDSGMIPARCGLPAVFSPVQLEYLYKDPRKKLKLSFSPRQLVYKHGPPRNLLQRTKNKDPHLFLSPLYLSTSQNPGKDVLPAHPQGPLAHVSGGIAVNLGRTVWIWLARASRSKSITNIHEGPTN